MKQLVKNIMCAGITLLMPAGIFAQAIASPNTSLFAGSPASTYNGSTGGAICVTSSGALNTIGDGCLPTAARLVQPYGIAIDTLGNIYTADNNAVDSEIRVIYQGGTALAAALIAANPSEAFAPQVGHIYGFGAHVQTLTTPGAYCAGTAGPKTYDTLGDGCPAQYGVFTPRDVFVDANGNIFFTSLPNGSNYNVGYAGVRVIYVGGTQVASLIQAYNPAVTSVTAGSVYALSASGDFTGSTSSTSVPVNTPDGIGSIVLDSTGNLYVADTGPGVVAPTGLGAATAGNQIKKLSVALPSAGWTTYVGSGTGGSAAAYGVLGDGGPASLAVVDVPTTIFMDPNNNLYICDTGDSRVRVVYNSGSTPPLYVGTGSSSTAPTTIVTAPVPGDIYTVVGGIPYSSASTLTSLGNLQALLTIDGVVNTTRPQAAQFNPYTPVLIGMDPQGNLIVGGKTTYTAPVTNTIIYRVAATTGTVSIIGGVDASNVYGTISTAPASNVSCGSGTTGPVMSDTYGDGCPSIEVNPLFPYGRFVFDSAGNFYGVENRSASTTTVYSGGMIRKYTFPEKLGSEAVGGTLTVAAAFGFGGSATAPAAVYSTTPTPAFTADGNATTEFSDASSGANDICSSYTFNLTGTGAVPRTVENCVFSVAFTPAQPGPRYGSITVSSGSTVIGTVSLGGTGVGSEVTIDPGTATTIGTGLSPSGVGVDQGGNFFISDATSNKIYKSVGGGAPTAFSTTALNAPAQIAVGGTGTVYVADKGNNRLAQITTAGVVSSLVTTAGGKLLSGPTGAALDLVGNIYIADTGNNRIVEYSAGGGITVTPVTGLNAPKGLAVDAAGDLFIADSGNARIVEFSQTGVQSVVNLSTTLTTPVGVAVDAAGDLYIADAGANTILLLPVGSTTSTTLESNLTGLVGLAIDSNADVLAAYPGAGGLTEWNRSQVKIPFDPTNVGSTLTQLITVSDAGNANLTTGSTLSAGTDNTDFSVAPGTTNGCTINSTIVSGANCGLATTFQPQLKAALQDTVTFPTYNSANKASALLTGTGVQEIASTTTLSYTTSNGGLPLQNTPLTLKAVITTATNAGPATGTVVFAVDYTQQPPVTVSGNSASVTLTLPPGMHVVTATYSGDGNYASSEATQSITVLQPAPTTVALTTNVQYAQAGMSFMLTAAVSSAASSGAITGSVAFTVDGGAPTTVTVTNSSASIPLTLTLGSHTVVATYSGSGYYLSSTKTITIQVYPDGTSSIKLAIVSPTGTITYGQPVTVSTTITTANSTATPTGTVTYSVDGTTLSSTGYAAMSSTVLSLPGGTHTLSATYSGDGNYEPATASITITIAQATTVFTLQIMPNVSSSSTPASNANYFVLTATVGSSSTVPTGTVTFSNGTTVLGTKALIGGVATLNTTTVVFNSYAFTATYSGDGNFLPATATVTPGPTFLLSSSANTVSAVQGAVGLLTVNLNSFFNDAANVTFSCTGMPTSSVCRGPTGVVPMTANAVNAEQIQFFTNVTALGQTAKSAPAPRLWMLDGVAICFCIGLPLCFRRTKAWRTLLCVCVVAGLAAMSGCGTNTSGPAQPPLTPAGTYAVVLSATDGTTIQTLPVTFTVVALP